VAAAPLDAYVQGSAASGVDTANGGWVEMRLRASGPRWYLFQMVLAVVVLDALAIAAYSFTGLRLAGPNVRTAFTAGWTLATAIIVGIGLRRIRLARGRGTATRRRPGA